MVGLVIPASSGNRCGTLDGIGVRAQALSGENKSAPARASDRGAS